MKIIHFITAIDRSLGGVSMYIQLLAKELGKKSNLIIVTRPTANPLPIENAKIIYLPLPLKEIRNFKNQWIKILEEEKPDVVHINGIWMIQTWIIQKEALKKNTTWYVRTMDNKSALSKKKISTYFVSKKSTAKSNCISGYSKK